MAFWIEIHCDINDADFKTTGRRCYSADNHHVCDLFPNHSYSKASRILSAIAIKSGWLRFRKNNQLQWACPNCKLTLDNSSILKSKSKKQ